MGCSINLSIDLFLDFFPILVNPIGVDVVEEFEDGLVQVVGEHGVGSF